MLRSVQLCNVISMETMCSWARGFPWRPEVICLTFCCESFVCLCWQTFLIGLTFSFLFFFLHLFGLSIFIFPLSSKPFWHFVLCAWLSVFPLSPSQFLSLNHLLSLNLSLCLPLSASFYLFLYLSQRELMWPLCAVSSLRGRQSSSAPIRTAVSGAVTTTGLPTHSSVHERDPPPTGGVEERYGKEQVTLRKQNKKQTGRKESYEKILTQAACLRGGGLESHDLTRVRLKSQIWRLETFFFFINTCILSFQHLRIILQPRVLHITLAAWISLTAVYIT